MNSKYWSIEIVIGNLELIKSLTVGAKNFSHHANEFEHAFVINVVIYTVSLFFACENVFFPKYGQVLGDVALACADLFYNVLDLDPVTTQYTENF